MIIFTVDDEPHMLNILHREIKEAEPSAQVHDFTSSQEAITAVKQGTVPDIVFSDIDMPIINGIELAKRLKLMSGRVNIIFTTGYKQYMEDALKMHVSGYLTKPITAADIREELDNLRNPIIERSEKRVRFQTFGNFEVFIDGSPITFERKKTKEYLAYLVDRGTLVSNREIISALWEEEVTGAYIRALRRDLISTFGAYGCGDVIIIQWNKQGIDQEKVECDYYDWKKGLPQAINAYNGEYMSQYSWAEFTKGLIE